MTVVGGQVFNHRNKWSKWFLSLWIRPVQHSRGILYHSSSDSFQLSNVLIMSGVNHFQGQSRASELGWGVGCNSPKPGLVSLKSFCSRFTSVVIVVVLPHQPGSTLLQHDLLYYSNTVCVLFVILVKIRSNFDYFMQGYFTQYLFIRPIVSRIQCFTETSWNLLTKTHKPYHV